MSLTADILKYLFRFMSSTSISRLAMTSKVNNYVISRALINHIDYANRLDSNYPNIARLLTEYRTFNNKSINTVVYKSLLCRISDLYNLKSDVVINVKEYELFDNTDPFKIGTEYFDYPELIIKLLRSSLYNELLEVCYFFHGMFGEYASKIKPTQCIRHAFVYNTNFFAKLISYGIIINQEWCDALAEWSYDNFEPLKRLLLKLESFGNYSESWSIALTIIRPSILIDWITQLLEGKPNLRAIKLYTYLSKFIEERRLTIYSNHLSTALNELKYRGNNSDVKTFIELLNHIVLEGSDFIVGPMFYPARLHNDTSVGALPVYRELEVFSGKKLMIERGLSDRQLIAILNYLRGTKELSPYTFDAYDLLYEIKTLDDRQYYDFLTDSIVDNDFSNLLRLLMDSRAKNYDPDENPLIEFARNEPELEAFKIMIRILTTNSPINDSFNIDKMINDLIKELLHNLNISRARKFLIVVIPLISDNELASEILTDSDYSNDYELIKILLENKKLKFNKKTIELAIWDAKERRDNRMTNLLKSYESINL